MQYITNPIIVRIKVDLDDNTSLMLSFFASFLVRWFAVVKTNHEKHNAS